MSQICSQVLSCPCCALKPTLFFSCSSIKGCKVCQADCIESCCCTTLIPGMQCRQQQNNHDPRRFNIVWQATLGCLPMHIVSWISSGGYSGILHKCSVDETPRVLQLKEIIAISAPTDVWQDASRANGSPDILPVLVPPELATGAAT